MVMLPRHTSIRNCFINWIDDFSSYLLLETFHDPEEEKDFPKLPNILQSDNTTDQPGNSCRSRTK